MLQIAHLLALADEFQRVTSLGDTTLSFRVFGDSKKLTALRATSDITTARFNAAIKWFAEHWPDEAAWPKAIKRPVAA